MASEEVLGDLREMVRKIMQDECVEQYDINIEGALEKGVNFIGDILFFNVKSKTDGKKYSLVMKTAKRSEELRKTLCDGIFYRIENYMYLKVFPSFKEFSKHVNPSFKLDFFPKLFGVIDEEKRESLVLENLKTSGYKLWDKTKPMNLEHILLAMVNYGKFHALSLGLKDKQPTTFQGLLDGMGIFETTPDMVVMIEKEFRKALKLLSESGFNRLADEFMHILNNFSDCLLKERKEDDVSVIVHGDCWNNNIIFKYEGETSSKPTKLCFLDFQVSKLDVPVKDLSYFLYTTCDGFALKQLNLLLKTYYDSLSTTLEFLGCQPDKIFTFQQLEEQWREFSLTGLLLVPMVLQIALCSPEDAPDMELIGKEVGPSFSVNDENIFIQRLVDVFSHYSDTCL